jgi:hypothetical protein
MELVCVPWTVLAVMGLIILGLMLGWHHTLRQLRALTVAWEREHRERGGETMLDLPI